LWLFFAGVEVVAVVEAVSDARAEEISASPADIKQRLRHEEQPGIWLKLS